MSCENLNCYILHYPISLQRLSMTRNEQEVYHVNYPRDNKTNFLMKPVQFLIRLQALSRHARYPDSPNQYSICRFIKNGSTFSRLAIQIENITGTETLRERIVKTHLTGKLQAYRISQAMADGNTVTYIDGISRLCIRLNPRKTCCIIE